MTFFKQLEQLCKSRNESVYTVIEKLGYSNAMPSKWRHGATPNGAIIIQFSQYFNVSCDYLLGLTNDPIIYYNRSLAHSGTSALMKYFSLTEEDQAKVDTFLGFLLTDPKYDKAENQKKA